MFHRRYFSAGMFALGLSLSGCSSSNSGGNTPATAPPPPPDQAIGGAWSGTDSNGLEILALSTESGRLHWLVPETGEQGFGIGSVNGSNISLSYTYVAPFGFTLADGSASATCSASGTIQERQSIALTTNCTTALGEMLSASVALTYDPLYDQDSSLALIAGNYDDAGAVLNVNADGVVFEQDPETGCVLNGQISVIDPQFNAYDISVTYDSCDTDLYPELAPFNGATFTGLGILDDTVDPVVAIVGLTGDAGAVTVSAVFSFPRI